MFGYKKLEKRVNLLEKAVLVLINKDNDRMIDMINKMWKADNEKKIKKAKKGAKKNVK